MTRRMAALILLLAIPAGVSAQSPAPSIGLPLPPIGLPLPALGLPPADTSAAAPTNPPPQGTPQVPAPAIVFFGAPWAWGIEAWQHSPMPGMVASKPETYTGHDEPDDERNETPLGTGTLQLEIKPRDAQIFVDGAFVGTWADVGGELELTPGTHQVEIRAPRHEALSFDARIVSGRRITYRGTLAAIEERSVNPQSPGVNRDPKAQTKAPPDATPGPVAGSTFYLIPGCYLGNVPPEQIKLPAGCDLSRMITNKPPR